MSHGAERRRVPRLSQLIAQEDMWTIGFMEPLLNIKELAGILGISKSQAEVLITRGDLPTPLRIGNLRRWSVVQVESWIQTITPTKTEKTDKPAPQARRGRPRRTP